LLELSPQIIHVLFLGTVAGLATTAGAALVMYLGKPGENILAFLLAAAGGVMLAVVVIDLLPTAWSYGPPYQVAVGLFLGIVLMSLAVSTLSRRGSPSNSRRQRLKNTGLLIAMGIALHDIPEGMAIAVGHEATSKLGGLIALAITLHNLPEGMATAAPLRMAGIRRYKVILLSLGMAMVTPLGSALGLIAISFVSGTLTLFLSLAAGAMGLLVFQELLPTSRERHPNWSRLGVAVGFVAFGLLSLTF
jgi:zinc transporter, ZIP family